MDCWVDPDSLPPRIGGNFLVDANEWGELAYKKLKPLISYMGELIIGGGEILGPFSYGFDWFIYELVHELHFEQGHLVETNDRSNEAAQYRSPTDCD